VKLAVVTGRKEHAARINAAWQEGVNAVIETGLRIIDAREGLEHGEYLAMIAEDLNCSRSTAFKLVAIASNKTLANVSHGKHLPAAWTVLYDLSAAANKGFDLESGIESGAIHPKMERKDVKALLPPPQRDDDLEEPDEEDGQPAEAPKPDEDEPVVNPLVVAWANAGPEARRDFVRTCWSEIIRARGQVRAANHNGNGADHGAQPSKENAEASDRWIESDSL
jgi:hypothetical protein